MKISANEARAYLSQESQRFAEGFLSTVYDEIYKAAKEDKREANVYRESTAYNEIAYYVKRDLEDHGYIVQMDRYCNGFNLRIHW